MFRKTRKDACTRLSYGCTGPTCETKLKQVGVSRVICPHVIGATRVANVPSRPNVVDFVEMADKGVDFVLDEYLIPDASPFAVVTWREAPLH